MLPARKGSEGPFETRTSIGGRCKTRKRLSRAVLIARVAWPVQAIKVHHFAPTQRCGFSHPSKPESFFLPASIARGPHPFPSRTRSLSLAARMVLPGPLGGRVRRRRHIFLRSRSADSAG